MSNPTPHICRGCWQKKTYNLSVLCIDCLNAKKKPIKQPRGSAIRGNALPLAFAEAPVRGVYTVHCNE